MAKFICSTEVKEYYLATEIEAQDEAEAEAKYQEMLDNGDIAVNKSEYEEIRVRRIQ